MNFTDNVTLADVRTLDSGGIVAMVPTARTGIQDYAGYEMGKPDMPVVRVYRSPEEVFSDDAMKSAAHKPITIKHPRDGVSAANWSALSKGVTGAEIRKDEAAGLLYVPMMIADQEGVTAATTDHKEVSWGYSCEIDWTPGVTADGQAFDASQRDIRMNHLALVPKGRAGYSCRVGDAWEPILDNKEPSVALKTLKIASVADGMPFEATDAAETIINKLVADREELAGKVTAADAKIVERDASIVAKDAEIAKLKKDVADAALTPAKLRDAAKVYAVTMAKAKALGATVTDSTSEADAHKMVVDAAMGDTAKDYTADQYALAFNVLAKDAKVEDADPLREAIRDNQPPAEGAKKAQTAYDAMIAGLEGGYKNKDA